MRRKPTLGYPTRAAAVSAMRASGMSLRDAEAKVGWHATRGISAKAQERLRRSVHVSRDVLEELAPDAARRGICVTQLAKRIITAVVDDGLVDAVLDDR